MVVKCANTQHHDLFPDGYYRKNNAAQAYGHFTFGNYKLHYRFLKKPIFVNNHHCYERSDKKNPYVSYRQYDESQRSEQET